MKSKLRIVALVTVFLLLFLFAFGFGYYRGSQDCSRKSTSFYLALNEGLYQNLQKNRTESVESGLKAVIYSEAMSLRALEQTPLGYFEYEVLDASAGDIPKQLQKADEITKGLSFIQGPAEPSK